MQKRGEMKQLKLELEERRLFEQIIARDELIRAFAAVKANKGAAGIDDVSVEMFEINLQEELTRLIEEVSNWTYRPQAVRRVMIPKPGSTKERPLGIPCVRDRVLQYAIKTVIEPLFEKDFSESSYGFRPGRRQQQALNQAKSLVQAGKEWVVDIDLENFFGTINHDKLIFLLSKKVEDNRVTRLIGMTLRSGVMIDGSIEPTQEGSVQGSPLSPLLSNVMLDELDKELEKRELSFCRWADDCNIFVSSERAAQRVMASISKFIEGRLKLKVNREKSKVSLSSGVKFLGMTIAGVLLVIANKSMAKAMDTVKELTPRRNHLSTEVQIEKINQWYKGWVGYFKMTENPKQLGIIEAHIRRRLRAMIIAAQKRKRYLAHKLIKQGVRRQLAFKTAYSPGNTWAKSISNAAHKAWSNRWFAQQGCVSLRDKLFPESGEPANY
jgi:group II intron reverse transcriptase/maturase